MFSSMKYIKFIPILTLAWTARTNAAVIINMVESAGNVVAVSNGTINLSGLSSYGTSKWSALVWGEFVLGSTIMVSSLTATSVGGYSGIVGPASFGSGAQILASSGSGTLFGIVANKAIYVPSDYVSGTPLASTSTWNGTTIAGLGLTPGSYIWTWGSGASADSATLNIEAVPEPSNLALLALGATALVVRRKRKTA